MSKHNIENEDNFIKENEYIFKKYKPIKKIGRGAFGNIYSIIRLKDKNVFAMKTEKINAKIKILESEAYYLYILQGFGIPKLITYGHTKKYNILIETLLDKSLFDIFIRRAKICNIIDACFIGMQILDRLEFIHSKDIIYRDVKPENFLIGINDPNVIYIVDFGLCKKYRSSKTGKHIFPKMTKVFNGTLRYASANAIRGKELSRRDDLISLGYMLIYLLKKNLPWESNLKNLNKVKYFQLLFQKDSDAGGILFKNVPPEMADFVKYTKNLKFEQDPDYSYLRSLLNKIFIKNDLNYRKLTFSWIDSKNKKLLGIPKNNSTRNSSPYFRILKNIKEKRDRKLKTLSLSTNRIKSNNSNITSSFLNENNEFSNCEKNLKTNSSDWSNHNFSFNNINIKPTTINLENKIEINLVKINEIPKPKRTKEIIYKRKNIHKLINKKKSVSNIKLITENNDSTNNMKTDINSENKSGNNFIINNEYQKIINPTIYIKKNIKKYSVSVSRKHSNKNKRRNIEPHILSKINFNTIDNNNLNCLRKKDKSCHKNLKSIKSKLSKNTIYKSPLLSIINDNEINSYFSLKTNI